MLLDAARGHIRGDVLDVCTGSGVVALSVAPHARRVTAVDSSRLAVAAVRATACANGLDVEALRSDLFAAVAGRRFDVILSNPPYLPAPAGTSAFGSRAWDGGQDGRAVLDRLCRTAPAHLRPGGDLFVVHSSLADIQRTLRMLAEAGLESSVAAVHEGALGPLARAQAEHLHAIGALAPRCLTEQVAVVRARRRPA
jgi:release factor glutamine methyltransferase